MNWIVAVLAGCDARIADWSARSPQALRCVRTLASGLAMAALAAVLLAMDPMPGLLAAAVLLAAIGAWDRGPATVDGSQPAEKKGTGER